MKTKFLCFCLINVAILPFFYSNVVTASNGMTIVWEYGKNREVQQYKKGTLLGLENDTFTVGNNSISVTDKPIINTTTYDTSGEFLEESNPDFNDNDFLWKSLDHLEFLASEDEQWSIKTVELAGKTKAYFRKIVFLYFASATSYYCPDCGVLVKFTNSDSGNYIKLIAWEDMDVKRYSLLLTIKSWAIGVSIIGVAIVLSLIGYSKRRKKNALKEKEKMGAKWTKKFSSK